VRRLRTLPALITLLAVGSGCAFIERVDVDTAGPVPSVYTGSLGLSSDGRFVTFEVTEPPEDYEATRIYVRDLQTATTELISISPFGAAPFDASAPAISSNGRWVTYTAGRTDLAIPRWDIFLFDRSNGSTIRVTDQPSTISGGVSSSSSSVVSVDGDKVAFLSQSVLLVPGDVNSDVEDVYVWTRSTDSFVRASVDEAGVQLAGASRDPFLNDSGRYVSFNDNFGQIYVRDLLLGTTDQINPEFGPDGPQGYMTSISENGRYVAFHDNTPGAQRAYRFDRTTDVLVTISLTSSGLVAGNSTVGAISGDGSMVTFVSDIAATSADLNPGKDLYARDIAAGRTKLLSSDLLLGDWTGSVRAGLFESPPLSRDGNYVAFAASGTGLVDGETNGIYVRATRHVAVTSAIPNTMPDGATTVIELVGTGFRPDTQVSLSGDARERWNVTLVHYLDENTMHITVQIVPGAAAGPVNIVAINPGSAWGPYKGAANWCLGCVQIT
jgi:WD40-like Beta Propeller Repeat